FIKNCRSCLSSVCGSVIDAQIGVIYNHHGVVMPHTPLSRRSFLCTSAVAATSALTLPASAQPIGANERINIGLIGTGGRCCHLMGALAKIPNTRMMGLCDIYEPNLQLAQKLADPNAVTTRDYRELLNRKDLHA